MLRSNPMSNVLDQALVPTSNAVPLTAFAREHGLDTERLLSEIGVTAEALCKPDQWMTVSQCSRLMALVSERTGAQALGYELGLRTPGTAHGLFGLGILSSATPQEALELAKRFAQLRNPTFDVSWSLQGAQVSVKLVDLMPASAMRQTSTEWVLLSMLRMGEALMSAAAADIRAQCELSFTWPQPPYHDHYASRLPNCRFNSPATALHFPADWLLQRLDSSAPASVQLARQACERDLTLRTNNDSLIQRVRACLDAGPASLGYPTREEVASRLNMSVSTLKRLLLREGRSYSALLNEIRLRDARRLLTSMDMSIADVATALGYQNTANFTRAFQQWSGMTPSQWRALWLQSPN